MHKICPLHSIIFFWYLMFQNVLFCLIIGLDIYVSFANIYHCLIELQEDIYRVIHDGSRK